MNGSEDAGDLASGVEVTEHVILTYLLITLLYLQAKLFYVRYCNGSGAVSPSLFNLSCIDYVDSYIFLH